MVYPCTALLLLCLFATIITYILNHRWALLQEGGCGGQARKGPPPCPLPILCSGIYFPFQLCNRGRDSEAGVGNLPARVQGGLTEYLAGVFSPGRSA